MPDYNGVPRLCRRYQVKEALEIGTGGCYGGVNLRGRFLHGQRDEMESTVAIG